MARQNKGGGFDRTFGTKGIVLTSILSGGSAVFELELQKSGKVVAIGLASDGTKSYVALARYLTD